MKNKVKKYATISLSVIFFVLMLVAIVQQANERIEENINKQKANQAQIAQVVNVQNETSFETTNQDEANELISEIQKICNKKSINL